MSLSAYTLLKWNLMTRTMNKDEIFKLLVDYTKFYSSINEWTTSDMTIMKDVDRFFYTPEAKEYIMPPTPSVGKSEGEEAKEEHSLHYRLVETNSEIFDAAKKLNQLLIELGNYPIPHSSGDRGRREWPSEEEINAERVLRYHDNNGLQLEDEDFYFSEGVKWVIDWLKSRIEGEEREETVSK